MRKTPLLEGQYYHIYNRGVDRRTIFSDGNDLERFFTSMIAFNAKQPVGSLFLESTRKSPEGKRDSDSPLRCLAPKEERLVDFVAYCLNPNHFHFILTPLQKGGASEYMKRLGGGYTNYFNEKHKRDGALFQGTFKSKHIHSDLYLHHVSVYVNLNNRVHKWDNGAGNLTKSSWDEYAGQPFEKICDVEPVMHNFRTSQGYKAFADEALRAILKKKEEDRALKDVLID